ncbi:MAG: hypothetical protein IT534_07570 [Bauldia sp.]|nr:hypothetical protein [Bauldia sp.]
MKKLLSAVAVGAAVLSSGAYAADIQPVIPAPVVVVPVPAAPGFDWSRLYVGAVAGAWIAVDPFGFSDGRAAGVAGVTFGERVLFGAEVQVGLYDFSSPTFEAFALARVGVPVGDRVQVLALGGINYDGDIDPVAGLGVEIGLGDRLSIRTDALVYWGDPTFVPTYVTVAGGLFFYFGR